MNSATSLIDDILERLCLIGFWWQLLHQKTNLGTEYDNHLNILRIVMKVHLFKK